MKVNTYIFLIFQLLLTNNSKAQKIDLVPYFSFVENAEYVYRAVYTTGFEDSESSINFVEKKSFKKDTVVEFFVREYRTKIIDGQKVMYAINKSDSNTFLLSDNFLSSVYYIKKNGISFCPVVFQNEIQNLTLNDFTGFIPSQVSSSDFFVLFKGTKFELKIFDFKVVSITIDHLTDNSCLSFKVIFGPDPGDGTNCIWISKKYGLIKWIRDTGRIETLFN